MQGKHNTMIKRIVDVCMTVLLLCLMAYQVTGEVLHEWISRLLSMLNSKQFAVAMITEKR